MIKELRTLFKKDSSKDYFITAAPQVCDEDIKCGITKAYIYLTSVHFLMPCWVMSLVKQV